MQCTSCGAQMAYGYCVACGSTDQAVGQGSVGGGSGAATPAASSWPTQQGEPAAQPGSQDPVPPPATANTRDALAAEQIRSLQQLNATLAEVAKDISTVKSIISFFAALWVLGVVLLLLGVFSADSSSTDGIYLP